MTKLWPRRMWAQMAIVLALLVTIPLTLLGILLIGASQTAVRTSVLRDHEQLAIRAASEVGEFVKRPRHLLITTASILGMIHADLWKEETVLVELALDEEIFSRISSVGLDGKEAVTSKVGTPLRDYSQEEGFKKAAGGEYYMSDVFISPDHTPYAVMSVPVRQMGKIAGVLSAEVNLRGLWEIVDNIKIGRTGRAYVISEDGVLVAHEDKKKVLANENLSADTIVKAVLAGEAGSVESRDASGRWLYAYAPIKDLGWGVVVRQAAAEAYAFSHLMKVQSWILILFSLSAAVIISVLLGRLLVQPIQALVRGTHRVAQGDFGQTIPVGRQDEIGNLINAFNQMTEKLKKAREAEKLASVGKAAAAIAHDLKNALVTAATFIGLLPTRYQDKEFLEKFVKVVPEELESWRSMLQDISDFSRQSKFELSRVDVGALLADFRFLAEERLTQSGIRLDWGIAPDLPPITGNAQRLKQLFMNLVVNSMEAMPKGGTLKMSAALSKNNLEIRIEDTGKGITQEHIQRIFEPFYTTKNNGLGLGLAISKGIVEQHGGRIQVESEIGRGTAFVVRFPVEKAREAALR